MTIIDLKDKKLVNWNANAITTKKPSAIEFVFIKNLKKKNHL